MPSFFKHRRKDPRITMVDHQHSEADHEYSPEDSLYSEADREMVLEYINLVMDGDLADAEAVLARAKWTKEAADGVFFHFYPERADNHSEMAAAPAVIEDSSPVRVYTAAEMETAKAALSLNQLGENKSALKLLEKRGLNASDVPLAVDQYWVEVEALGGEADEPETSEPSEGSAPEASEPVEVAEPEEAVEREPAEVSEPGASTPHGVERMVVPVESSYKDSVEKRANLIANLWRKFGDGWQVEVYDETESSVGIVRGELPAMRPGAAVYGAGPTATPGNAAAIAAAHAANGRTMLGYDPYRGEVETAVLPPVTMVLRDRLLRKNPRQKSWELELLPIFGVRDGVGYLAKVIITRADQISPDRDKEIAYWLGIAKNTIGHSGWWVSIDDARGVVEMAAGTPINMPSRVGYDYDVIQNGKWGELVVGRDGYNKPVIVDLSATPHALVVGRTGSGKSIFLQTMVFSALVHGFEVALLDPTKEGLDFRCFQPYLRDGGWGCESFPEALAALKDIYEEAKRRKKVLSALSAPKWLALSKEDQIKHGIKPILVVVDEGTALAQLATLPKLMDKESPEYIELAEEDMAKEQIMYYVGRILRECRFVGIHLVFGTQRFGVQTIGQGAGELRENMGARVILGRSSTTSLAMACADPQDAAAAYEQAHGSAVIPGDPSITGREPTPGRGLAEIDGRGHVALQGAFAETDELVEHLTAMGVPAYEGDRRPVVPEKETPFGFQVIEQSYIRPEEPEVEDLEEMEFKLEDLESELEDSPVDAPVAAEPQTNGEDPFAAEQAIKQSPSAPAADADPFAVDPKTRPRLSTLGNDPFGEQAPAKPKPKVKEFEW